MEKVSFISAQHVKIEFEMASVLQRGLAYIIDTAIGYVYLLIVMLSLIDSAIKAYSELDVLVGLFILLVNLPIVLYKPLMEYFFNGQTLGKNTSASIRLNYFLKQDISLSFSFNYLNNKRYNNLLNIIGEFRAYL